MASAPHQTQSPLYQTTGHEWIYAARIVRTGLIKVGFTVNIFSRINNLRSQFRSDIELLGVTEGSISIERAFHKQSADSCLPCSTCLKETYYPTEKILNYISRQMRDPRHVFGETFSTYSTFAGQKPLTPSIASHLCQRILALPPEKREQAKNRLITLYSRVYRDHRLGHDVSGIPQVLRKYFGDLRSIHWLEFELNLAPHPDKREVAA